MLYKKLLILLFILIGFTGCKAEEEQNSNSSFTSFSFLASNNSQLTSDVQGSISGTTVSVTLPSGTDNSSLVATYSTEAVKVTMNGITQTSGSSVNDFSYSPSYWLSAEDGSYQYYKMTVDN